jgi:hypothetical protein
MADNFDVLVNIRAQGVESARAARDELKALGDAAGGGAGGAGGGGAASSVDRLGTAFERFEQRGPTRIIRQASFAFESLAASAIGVEGPVGRVAATMLQFGIGGGVGLVAIGGFAAIGGAIKQTIDYADQLDASLRAMSTTLAGLVASAGPLMRLGDLGSGEGPESDKFKPPQPGFLARGFSRIQGAARGLRGLLIGRDEEATGDVEQAFDIASESGDSARMQAARILRGQITAARQRAIEADRKRRADEAERRRKELDRQAVIDAGLAGFSGSGLGGAAPLGSNRLGFGTPPGRDLALGFNERPRVPGALERDLGIDIKTLILGHPGAPPVDESFPAAGKGIDFRRLIAAGVGFAGTAAGIGGASTTQKLGRFLEAGAGVAEVIPGGQLPGAVLAGLGGLISLFGSGKKPAMVIDEFGERAKAQLREIGAYVQNGSVVVVSPTGGDALRNADYALQNAGRLDATPRLPVPLSR